MIGAKNKTRSNVRWKTQPPITEKACVALPSIESADYVLNDFRFLGCLRQSNYPVVHITIRFTNSKIQTTQPPPRSTEVNALNQLKIFIGQCQ